MWEVELQAGGKTMEKSTANKQTQPTGTFTRATAKTTTHHCAHVHDSTFWVWKICKCASEWMLNDSTDPPAYHQLTDAICPAACKPYPSWLQFSLSWCHLSLPLLGSTWLSRCLSLDTGAAESIGLMGTQVALLCVVLDHWNIEP